MIIKTKLFKEVCSTILLGIDNTDISTLTETLELKTEEKTLILNVTNGEYYVSVKFPLDHEEDFSASVNANLFLKLISAVTTEDIELEKKKDYLQVKANGTYKIPFIYDGSEEMLKLPEITINNPTTQLKISGEILNSILVYNSKELQRGTISKPVQKLYYVDEKGCLTFTTGACVNYFELEKPIKVLFNNRLVKLFKLFKGEMTDFTLGYDPIDENLVQTKVRFETPSIILTAITGCTDDLLRSVPVAAIRGRAEKDYPYSVVLNTQELKEAINRLLLFSAGYGSVKNLKPYSKFEFLNNQITIYDSNNENTETFLFKNDVNFETLQSFILDLSDLKLVVDTVTEDYLTLSFGDHQAVVLKRGVITNVFPECIVKR